MAGPLNVLVLNAGSSSLKFQIIATDLERIGSESDQRLSKGDVDVAPGAMAAALEQVLGKSNGEKIDAVGHRVVHGGERFTESALIDKSVLAGIRECVELAPLHNPANLQGIEAATEHLGPDIPQVAVFDTAFHHSIPEHAHIYAIPYEFYKDYGVRRYGFHGTSHRYVTHRYRKLTGKPREQTRIISLHLGNGCSAAAIRNGRSVDTSMGMTPLEGLVMGTRSGDVDPAVVTLIANRTKISAEDAELLLNKKSGLLGISGKSSDMRELQQELEHSGDARVKLAIDAFCYRARKYIGAYLAAMDGAEAIVFTGGIGQNSPEVRAGICAGLGWAGLNLDAAKNASCRGAESEISTPESTLRAYAIPTDEELLIARDTVRCIAGVPHPS